MCFFFFFKQKTAYEMRISDWSSDVCSSDLVAIVAKHDGLAHAAAQVVAALAAEHDGIAVAVEPVVAACRRIDRTERYEIACGIAVRPGAVARDHVDAGGSRRIADVHRPDTNQRIAADDTVKI